MNPSRVDRNCLRNLMDLPNIGKAMAEDLRILGIHEPGQLVGLNALEMYDRLCEKTGCRQDPCVIDVFISVTRFMNGEDPRPWWTFTAERKQMLRERGSRQPPAPAFQYRTNEEN